MTEYDIAPRETRWPYGPDPDLLSAVAKLRQEMNDIFTVCPELVHRIVQLRRMRAQGQEPWESDK